MEMKKYFDIKSDFDEEEKSDIKSDLKSHLSKNEILESCSNCQGYDLIVDTGVVICTNCGAENGIVISSEQEWRYFGADDNKNMNDPSRCGFAINPLLPESSQNTIILSKNNNFGYKKLHHWGAITYGEKKLIKIFGDMTQNTYNTGITKSALDKAEVMYKSISGVNKRRGNTKKGIIAACIFESCKDKGILRSAKEISEMYNIKIKKMTTGYKEYKEMMYYENKDYAEKIVATSAIDFIKSYGEQFKLDDDVIEFAIFAYEIINELGIIMENTPPSAATGILYFAAEYCEVDLTKKTISDKCKKSEVTIFKTYKKIVEYKPYIEYRFVNRFNR